LAIVEAFWCSRESGDPSWAIRCAGFASGQTESFSIHTLAELKHIPITDIANHYDSLEKSMLDEFSEYLKANIHCTWVHWNMRDINYGFQAIEHRHRALGGSSTERLPEERKFDLARALIASSSHCRNDHRALGLDQKSNILTEHHAVAIDSIESLGADYH
jgi:hypothetical protein